MEVVLVVIATLILLAALSVKWPWLGVWIAVTIAVLAIGFGAYAFSAWLLMVCWNFVVPGLFGLPQLTFWKSFALYVVLSIIGGAAFCRRSKTS